MFGAESPIDERGRILRWEPDDKSLPSNQARQLEAYNNSKPPARLGADQQQRLQVALYAYSHPQFLRNVLSAPTVDFSVNRSTAMADRSGLRLIGFLFATVTIAVMSTTVLVVKGQADANHLIENSSASMPLR